MARKRASSKTFDEPEDAPDSPGSGALAGDLLVALLPVLRDFVPVLLEKWSESADRPTLRGLEEEGRRLRQRMEQLERRSLWLSMFLVIQAVAFLFFVLLVALKML